MSTTTQRWWRRSWFTMQSKCHQIKPNKLYCTNIEVVFCWGTILFIAKTWNTISPILCRVKLKDRIAYNQAWKQHSMSEIYSSFKDQFAASLPADLTSCFLASFPSFDKLKLYMRRCKVSRHSLVSRTNLTPAEHPGGGGGQQGQEETQALQGWKGPQTRDGTIVDLNLFNLDFNWNAVSKIHRVVMFQIN